MWLCRAGRYGEFENKFLEDSKVYCTWDNLSESIMQFHTKQDLQQYFVDNNPDVKVKTAMNWASQVWPFAHEMKKGEIVGRQAHPSRSCSASYNKIIQGISATPCTKESHYFILCETLNF